MTRSVDPVMLVNKARRFALAAIDDYCADNHDFFALHAGTSFEALGKSLLAEKNPVLLLELGKPNGTPSLLHLAGVKDDPKNLRTIMASEVVRRVRLLHVGIDLRAADCNEIIADRNAAAHLHVVPGGLHRAFVHWVRATEALLAKVGDAPIRFWPDEEMISTALASYESDVRGRVETKMARARQRFLSWQLDMGGEAVIDGIRHKRSVQVSETEALAPCPVCWFAAVVGGSNASWGYDDEDCRGEPVGFFVEAEYFRCTLCGLRLDGWDELQAAGVDGTHEREPPSARTDPDEFDRMSTQCGTDDASI